MPDLTERILLQAEDIATAILKEFGGTLEGVGATLVEVSDIAEIADEYLASLGDTAFTTGVGFDGMLSPIELTADALDNLDATLAETAAAADATTASLEEVVASEGELAAASDVAATSVDTSGLSIDAFGAKTATTDKVLKGFVGTLGTIAAVTGVAVVAGSVLATKSAGDFESQITGLSTGAGELQSNLKMVGDGVLDVANKTGEGTKQLTDGLFLIDSSGQKGAQSLKTLQDAAEGAKVGQADLGVVANATTTIMTDYANENVTSTEAVNGLLMVVSSGKTHMQDLAGSMGSVLPLASSLGVSFPQVGGAIATMTNAGMDAQRASQDLANAMRALSAPNGAASKSMAAVGLTANQVSDSLSNKGLAATLQLVEDHVGNTFPAGSEQAKEALKSIMGGATGLNVALMLSGQNMKTFQGNISSVSNAMQNGGNSIQGWSQVQGDFNFKMDQAREGLETFGIKLGTQLIPLVSQLMANVGPAVAAFGNWVMQSGVLTTVFSVLITVISTLVTVISNVVHFFQQNHAALVVLQVVLIAVAGAIGGILVAAFVAWAIAAWNAAIATLAATWPILLIGAIIALVVAGIILAVMHWGEIVDWLKGVWGNVVGFFEMIWAGILVGLHAIGQFFVNVWNGIVAGLQAAWNAIVTIVRIGVIVLLVILFAPIIAIAALFIWLYQHNTYFKMMIDAIVNFVKTGIAWLQMAWQVTVAWIAGAWLWLVGAATATWAAITGAIQVAINFVVAVLLAMWTYASNWLSDQWNGLADMATTAWKAVSNVFSSIWDNYIHPPLQAAWNNLTSFLDEWGPKALDAGQNFINMLVSGIKAGAGAIWDAVTGIANNIWKALGFHSPAEAGPASDADEWMPNLIKMLSADLRAGAPQMEAAAVAVAQPLATNLGGGTTGIASQSGTGAAVGGIYITINVDGRSARTDQDLVNMLMDKLSRQLNRSGNLHPWIAGGKA